MRSYWMSMSFVAALIIGYTAMVFNSHSSNGSAQQNKELQHNASPNEPREPAAAPRATTTEASTAAD
jgi:hypothetical protein